MKKIMIIDGGPRKTFNTASMLLIALMIWALIRFGSYLYSLVV